jgi:phosphopantothenoylcysteine decarboxylase/phosphopantothenate--cysteine ligase
MADPFPPRRCLITAGPTREHLDPVRFLSNGSSGKMGYALAAAAVARGWAVDLVSGPVALPPPPCATVHPVVSAAEMLEACRGVFPRCDLFVAVAAVADYRPRFPVREKSGKSPDGCVLELIPTVDVLKTLAAERRPGQIVVGFAAQTSQVEAYARRKLVAKRLDWIVANDVGQAGIGMNADDNTVLLLGRDGTRESFGPAPKRAVAEFLLDRVAGSGTRGDSGAEAAGQCRGS